jgi:hypothetical protein
MSKFHITPIFCGDFLGKQNFDLAAAAELLHAAAAAAALPLLPLRCCCRGHVAAKLPPPRPRCRQSVVTLNC